MLGAQLRPAARFLPAMAVMIARTGNLPSPARLARSAPGASHIRSPSLHIYVDFHRTGRHPIGMNAQELKRYLARQGCTFETHSGGSGTSRYGGASAKAICRCMVAENNQPLVW
jgi:hypothetical protein